MRKFVKLRVLLSACIVVCLSKLIAGGEHCSVTPDLSLDSLFPNDSFAHAYETYPLLSRRIADDQLGHVVSDYHQHIRTVSLPPNSYIEADGQKQTRQQVRQHQINDLFQFDHLNEIFRRTDLDYKVVKKIAIGGEEMLAIIPHDQVATLKDVIRAHQQGFSLIFDKLQDHWPSVSKFARELEVETQQTHVSCNLYMTPPNHAALESHWDWMDVIVLQLSGQKTWSVASEPTVCLSNQQQKRIPTPEEINATTWYEKFVLKPGDALYIPRGTMHNATSDGFVEESSLHLTFGIESTATNVVSLILDAIIDDEQFLAKYHDSIRKLEPEICALRRSVTFHPSVEKLRPVKGLFEAGVETIAEHLEPQAGGLFRQLAKERYDIAIQNYQRRVQTVREQNWKWRDARLKAAMEATIGF